MQRIRVPPLYDVVRIASHDPEEAVKRLLDHVTAQTPAWTYQPVRQIAPPLLAGQVPLSAALHACLSRGSSGGRGPNAEAAQLVAEAGHGRILQCYRLSPRYFNIRRDMNLRVPAPFYLVENDLPVVFWLQPRKGFALNDMQRRLLATVVHMSFAPDWDKFDFEILDLSTAPGSKHRSPRTFRLVDMPLLPEAEVENIMQRFADAFDTVSAMDIPKADDWKRRPEADDSKGIGPLFD